MLSLFFPVQSRGRKRYATLTVKGVSRAMMTHLRPVQRYPPVVFDVCAAEGAELAPAEEHKASCPCVCETWRKNKKNVAEVMTLRKVGSDSEATGRHAGTKALMD